MLVRLLFASRAAAAMDADALAAIVRQGVANNPRVGVTGVLCHSGGFFMQVLEGGRDAVSRLYNRIAADPCSVNGSIGIFIARNEEKTRWQHLLRTIPATT